MLQGLTSRMTAVVSRRGALRGSASALSYPSSASTLRCRASSSASAAEQPTYDRFPARTLESTSGRRARGNCVCADPRTLPMVPSRNVCPNRRWAGRTTHDRNESAGVTVPTHVIAVPPFYGASGAGASAIVRHADMSSALEAHSPAACSDSRGWSQH
jgi:hypothetical protein